MIIHPSHIHEDPVTLHATLPPEVLELNDALARATHPIEARLTAYRITPDEILITGSLVTTLTLICGRCALPMPWPVSIENFTHSLIAPFPTTVNLTPQLREDILLQIPHIAQCTLSQGYICPITGEQHLPRPENNEPIGGRDNWKALDQLKNINQ
jgi:uncharacterized metal-binding protein YceD (DUF177 family)